ncbi:hypothetical protein F4808DRAFT_410212 [Astrocystis sublimbata]|nr:hypothetical protein F4808DRAFT_410212 [Astrocystis sublimbata]
MNNSRPTAYTPLESLFLFQLIGKYGFINNSFDRIAQELHSNPLVIEQDEYDAGRLTPGALQQLALQLLAEERRREADAAAERGANGLSPTSKKRKLQTPPLPTLKEAHEHPEKLPILVDRLYARFRDDLVRQIREDERLFQEREREVDAIERGDWDERIRQEQRVDHPTARNGVQPERPKPPATPTPTPVPVPIQGLTPSRTLAPPPPTVPTLASPAPAPASAPAPAPAPAIQAPVPVRPPSKVQESTKRVEGATPSTTTPVAPPVLPQPLHDRRTLQPSPPSVPASSTPIPATASHPTPPMQPPTQPPLQSPVPSQMQAPVPTPVQPPLQPPAIRSTNDPRQFVLDDAPPEATRAPNGTTPVLQHPQLAPGYDQRPAPTPQLHTSDGARQPQHPPKANSPVPGQQGQGQTQAPLKWEPPYHHPPHQTPVPSPRPNYTPGTPRPSGYSHVSAGTPQAPHHGPHHVRQHTSQYPAQHAPHHPPQHAAPYPVPHTIQHTQNYAQGKPTPGQTQYAAPNSSAPSSPALLPPQNAGQIPPPFQSHPANATPDGVGQHGQHGQHQRPLATPVTMSSTPNVPRNTYQTPVLPPATTPVRPPSGMTATHPAMSTAKPPPQTLQPPHLPPSIRNLQQPPSHPPPPPSYPHQLSAPTTPSQPPHGKAVPRPFGTQNQQRPKPPIGPVFTQQPQPAFQTPVSTPYLPPTSQTRTPSSFSEALYAITGSGTKWITTPTPSTPRPNNVEAESYFKLESPAYELLSPPTQPARLPKPSPDLEKDKSKATMKTETTKPRGRPSRATNGVELAPENVEVSTAPDLPGPSIKNEEATPQTLQEAVDTAAIQTPQGRTPATIIPQSNKRKRQDSPLSRGPPTPATHVLWTRAFHKISMTALDQIIGHRYANMFANPIKPKVAPGYYDIILRPQDLKGIQKAITAGSKAAAATVATMSDVDSNSPAVWLPISIDLVPPRGIINIAQLERELIHMFANAIMYNPDPLRGLGPSFLRRYQSEEGEDMRGYEFDENGVVKETRNMFAEVEKLLGDLRNEVVPRAQAAIGSGSRSVSAAIGESMNHSAMHITTAADDEGGDETTGDSKRRRIRG